MRLAGRAVRTAWLSQAPRRQLHGKYPTASLIGMVLTLKMHRVLLSSSPGGPAYGSRMGMTPFREISRTAAHTKLVDPGRCFGARDEEAMADIALTRMRPKIGELRLALEGRFDGHHGLLLRMHLDHMDHLTGMVDAIDNEVD